MKFKIEQLAIYPPNPKMAIAFLSKIGASEWAHDHVVASGNVYGKTGSNEADLAFNYDLLKSGNEFEVLHYTHGNNWMDNIERGPSVSHIGMHCSEEELDRWKLFMKSEGVLIAQEVFTDSHTNPVIKDKRKYHYCIFATRSILGVDMKFIVRRDI